MDSTLPEDCGQIVIGLTVGHDPAACLIRGGRIEACIEEEKLCREKGKFGFPIQAFHYLITQYGLSPQTVTQVAVGGMIYNEHTRLEILSWITGNPWYARWGYVLRGLVWLGLRKPDYTTPEINKRAFEKAIQTKLGCHNAAVSFWPHHLSHAASAGLAAPFQPDLTVTCDGKGDDDAFNFYTFDREGTLTLIHQISSIHSVGQVYGVVTDFLGFKANRHEGKVMGLAAAGKYTELVPLLMDLFSWDGLDLSRKPSRIPVIADFDLPFQTRFRFKTATDPASVDYSLRSLALKKILQEHAAQHTREDLAFAVQQVTETVVLTQIEKIIKQHFQGSCSIALAGGVFANVVLNQKIRELSTVSTVFVQPAMGDGGLALGAAMLAAGLKKYEFPNAFLGADYTSSLPAFFDEIAANCTVTRLECPEKSIAQWLKEGAIVGFFQGAMEYGPRALGHRSILAAPFDAGITQRLNSRLERSDFMPFAPSVLEEYAPKYLEDYDPDDNMTRFMTTTYLVKTEVRDLLQAVVHIDGTCRPHIVRKKENLYYHAVLKAFSEETGCGAVVNTSFNTHEEPIVSAPKYALNALLAGRIDHLVIERYHITL